MLCMRSAAQHQAVSHITVILAFLIKHLTPLSSPMYLLIVEARADNSAM